ncbi:LytR C-terminal domain-containing protein [Streptomyces sp. ODS28]|uniref:LytR C-terminal domain-containing protein n=1 Tax=Streptomyces sp. ODS28 TaxID=3136688 RepID=UPI0031E6220D
MSMLTPPGMGGRPGRKKRLKGGRYGDFRYQGDSYHLGFPSRRRGRRRLAFASVAAVCALAVLGWGTLQLVDVFSGGDRASASGAGSGGSGGSGSAPCGPGGQGGGKVAEAAGFTADPVLRSLEERSGKGDTSGVGKHSAHSPGKVTVNVLNATKRGGLAKKTADELEKRGFKTGDVGNAPPALEKKVKHGGLLLGAPGAENTARLKALGTQIGDVKTRYEARTGKQADRIDLVIGHGFTKLVPREQADSKLRALDGLSHKPKPKPKPTATAATGKC